MAETEEKENSEEAQAGRGLRLEMRIDPETHQHLENVANYAAFAGVIPSDHRGNKTAWINYCLNLGEEWLKQLAKTRGDI